MKKILITTLASTALVTSGFSQAQIAWATSAGNGLISYSTDKVTSTAAPKGSPSVIPGYGTLNVAFFAATDGTVLTLANGMPNFAGWTDVGVDLHNISASGAGKQTSTLNLPAGFNPGGQNVEFEVVGWAGTDTTWAAAVANGAPLLGWSGEIYNGAQLGGLGWSQPTGNSTKTPTPDLPGALVTGAGAFQGLVLEPVPEPATIALGGLGAAALLLFRRRK